MESLILNIFKNFRSAEWKIRAIVFCSGFVISVFFSIISIKYFRFRDDQFGKEESKIHSTIEHWHQLSVDLRMGLRAQQNGHDRIAILAIDEESIVTEGRWPWNRRKIAQLIEKAMENGAKILSFDIIFSEEDQNSGLEAIRLMRERVSDQKTRNNFDDSFAKVRKFIDADETLAQTIKKYSDQIVMGAYSQGEDFKVPPYSDLCFDSFYENSYPYEYWERNSIKLIVNDGQLSAIEAERKAITNHLAQYFTLMQLGEAQDWIDQNPNTAHEIIEEFRNKKFEIDQNNMAGILVMAIANDLRNGRNLLKDITSEEITYDDTRAIFTSLKSILGQKNKNILSKNLATVGTNYCARFFTESDELFDIKEFKKIWGDSQEVESLFSNLSWGSLWNKESSDSPIDGSEVVKKINQIKENMVNNEVKNVATWVLNIPKLMDVSKHSGYFNAVQDKDGLIRRTRLLARHSNFYSPSLAFKTFLVDNNLQPKINLETRPDSEGKLHKTISKLSAGRADGSRVLDIPVDGSGAQNINYYGPSLSFPHISATQLLDDREDMTVSWRYKNPAGQWLEDRKFRVNKKEFLTNKIMIVGATAIGIYDLRVTPLDSNFPGVETHANVLSNLMVEYENLQPNVSNKGRYGLLTNLKSETWMMPIFLLIIGTILSLVLVFLGAIASAMFTISVLFSVTALDQKFLFENGKLTTIVLPILLIASLYMVITVLRYFSEERKKKSLKSIFEKYVSQEVVEEILSKPGAIELGGRKERMTVLFSDIREFTRIAEAVSPEALSQILNAYFTPMTNLVYENRGTLDKYIGDAIMAFWGAPLPLANHAEKAARCALQMQNTLKTLSEAPNSKVRGLKIGIGINTGDMNVGNMGSEKIRSYTVIGDAVNIGARLESLTKEYGVNILISADTYAEIGDKFWCREIENVYVKGKQTSLTVYELMAEKNGSSHYESMLEEYHQGLKLFKENKFEESADIFKKLTLSNSEDKIFWRYLHLCQKRSNKSTDKI